ncbi:MAG TPA: hypothetical protein PKC40_04450 [Saprospiraceae bacterium]|nr:hypothetical protein [Saprospiraceae bacterium]
MREINSSAFQGGEYENKMKMALAKALNLAKAGGTYTTHPAMNGAAIDLKNPPLEGAGGGKV